MLTNCLNHARTTSTRSFADGEVEDGMAGMKVKGMGRVGGNSTSSQKISGGRGVKRGWNWGMPT